MLTKRAFEILGLLHEREQAQPSDDEYGDAEIVCEGIVCYLGTQNISIRVVRNLLDHCCLSLTSGDEKVRRFALNGTGRAALIDPDVPERVRLAVLAGKAVNHLGYEIDAISPGGSTPQ